jgi:DNA-binding NtrC family response regulator
MVYNIVSRNHGGFIDIESKEGHGSTVHLYMPAATPECVVCADRVSIAGGTETILIVEDEKGVRKFLRESLGMLGYKVIATVDGIKGLDVFRKRWKSIDLIILDLITPRISGEETLNALLEIDPSARIIVSSGHGDDRLESIDRACGMLPKPYEISTLAQMIRNTLDTTEKMPGNK